MANQDPSNWSYNTQTGQRDIGINTEIGRVVIHSITPVSRPETVSIDSKHTSVRTVGANARSTGLPDRRVGRDVPTMGSGPRARGGGAVVMLINAVNFSFSMGNAFSLRRDRMAIAIQKRLLKQAIHVVNENMDLVPSQYQNNNDLGAIINFVFQGVNNTGNPSITTIGIDILERIERYDPQTQKVRPLILEQN